jgi:hypothetical protein
VRHAFTGPRPSRAPPMRLRIRLQIRNEA